MCEGKKEKKICNKLSMLVNLLLEFYGDNRKNITFSNLIKL